MAVATKAAPKAAARAKAPAKPKVKAEEAVAAPQPKQTEAEAKATALYNKAYEGFVRMAADAHRLTGDDLVLAHSVARLRVQAAIRTKAITCPRCEGTGKVPFDIEDGRCFACQPAPKKETKEVVAAA